MAGISIDKIVVSLSLDSDVLDAIDKKRERIPRSTYINHVLRQFLKTDVV